MGYLPEKIKRSLDKEKGTKWAQDRDENYGGYHCCQPSDRGHTSKGYRMPGVSTHCLRQETHLCHHGRHHMSSEKLTY
jgi:hypothetical protein